MQPKYTYDMIFHGESGTDGELACPSCRSALIHPTGHAQPISSDQEYSPVLGLTAWCECGETLELLLGNYKGKLGIRVARLSPMEPRSAG